jgi:hypothetical protein
MKKQKITGAFTVGNYKIDVWWDRRTMCYVTQLFDRQDNQIGTTDYDGRREAAAVSIDMAKSEALRLTEEDNKADYLRSEGMKYLDTIRGRLNADHARDDSDAELERILTPCVCGSWLVMVAKQLRDEGIKLIDRIVPEYRPQREIAALIETALSYPNQARVKGYVAHMLISYDLKRNRIQEPIPNLRPLYMAFLALCNGDMVRAELIADDHDIVELLRMNPVTASAILNNSDMSPMGAVNYLRIT